MIDGGPRAGADPTVDSKSGDKCTLEIKIADDLGKVNRPSASAPGLLAACSGQGKVLRLGRPVLANTERRAPGEDRLTGRGTDSVTNPPKQPSKVHLRRRRGGGGRFEQPRFESLRLPNGTGVQIRRASCRERV